MYTCGLPQLQTPNPLPGIRCPVARSWFFPKQLVCKGSSFSIQERVCGSQTPNPRPQHGCLVARLSGAGFTVKPMLFQQLRPKTQQTRDFSTFVSENTVIRAKST